MPVLVTGATGNAGSGIIAAWLARGLPARAGLRNGHREVVPSSTEAIALDFGDRAPWGPAL